MKSSFTPSMTATVTQTMTSHLTTSDTAAEPSTVDIENPSKKTKKQSTKKTENTLLIEHIEDELNRLFTFTNNIQQILVKYQYITKKTQIQHNAEAKKRHENVADNKRRSERTTNKKTKNNMANTAPKT